MLILYIGSKLFFTYKNMAKCFTGPTIIYELLAAKSGSTETKN